MTILSFGTAVFICQCGHPESSHVMMPLTGCDGAQSLTCEDCYRNNPERFCVSYRPIKARIAARIVGPENINQ